MGSPVYMGSTSPTYSDESQLKTLEAHICRLNLDLVTDNLRRRTGAQVKQGGVKMQFELYILRRTEI